MRFGALVPFSVWLVTSCHATYGKFELYNADTNVKMADLVDGEAIVLKSTSPLLSVQVSFPGLRVSSVKFGLDSNPNHQMETKAPFTLCGNKGRDIFPCSQLGLGLHTVTATSYTSRRFSRKRKAGPVANVTFRVVVNAFCTKGGGCDCQRGFVGDGFNCTARVTPCRNETTCLDCLDSQCNWSRGTCSEFCVLDTLCYSRTGIWGNPNPFNSTTAVCAQYDRDQVDQPNCRTRTNCTSCTSTIRTDGLSTCRWWTSYTTNFTYCGIEGCFASSCSTAKCPVVSPPTAVRPPSAPMALLAPSTTMKPPSPPVPAPTRTQSCRDYKNCLDCLNSECRWSLGQCSERCTFDVLCYTPVFIVGNPNPFNSPTAVCSQFTRDQVDEPNCAARTNCTSCTSTIRSDGLSKCRWFVTQFSNYSYCGIEGCFFSGCGTTSCPAVVPPPAVAPPAISKSGPVALLAPSTTMKPPSPPVPAPTRTQSCRDYKNCLECLNSECRWSVGTCNPVCATDTLCYTRTGVWGSPNFFNSPTAVCSQYDRDQVDGSICAARTNCTSCTSTIRSDGVSKCRWFVTQFSNYSYCGIEGCFFFGCGTTSCPAVVPPPAAIDPPPRPVSAPK